MVKYKTIYYKNLFLFIFFVGFLHYLSGLLFASISIHPLLMILYFICLLKVLRIFENKLELTVGYQPSWVQNNYFFNVLIWLPSFLYFLGFEINEITDSDFYSIIFGYIFWYIIDLIKIFKLK
ncbi:MAG: hypothetical protein CMH28_03430 [Micavibrio sp.]|nr:hypothetical protein [Micavibrio sp.]